jgi:outer membrane lipoprotein-sorting protein
MMLFNRLLSIIPLLLCSGLSQAASWDIDQLMHNLALTRSGHATFVEKKTLALLDQPVTSSGELLYAAPDRLEKRTIKPKVENMLVDGNNLVIERGKKTYHLQLSDYPELAAFIDSIRGTLAGDRKALERTYQLSLEGNSVNWTLQLIPNNARMQQVISRIRIMGAGDEVRSIDIAQTDGDSSHMQIEKVATP